MTQTTMHPIVEQLKPSAEQARCILARGRDVVVTAGAGAGKTRALVARYLALLAEGVPLRRIAAITFTRKAAQEMRNRIRREMRRYLAHPDVPADERTRWQEMYAALDAARIGTIHTLCGDILRSHPAEAGIDPRYDVLDEGRTALLRIQAVEETMGWAAGEEDVAEIFVLLSENGVRSTLTDMLNRRLEAQAALAAVADEPLSYWQIVLTDRQQRALAQMTGDPAWQEAADLLLSNAPLNPDDKLAPSWYMAHEALTALSEPLLFCPAALKKLDAINLTGGKTDSWPISVKEIKDALRTLRESWRRQLARLADGLNERDEALAAAIPALRMLFADVTRRYDALKDELNALDFDDLEERAVTLLRENAEVRRHWRDEIHTILVDEFQDTNGRQRGLVNLLNGEGGRLFVVGDAKQSIYRFRGADVTVFRQVRREIAADGGHVFPLATTYRAHAPLVQALNNLLRPVLGEAEDPARPWVEPFAPLNPYRAQPARGLAAPHVELHLAVGTKTDGALDRAADALAMRLIDLIERQEIYIGEREATRPLNYGDVAIVCRASTSFGVYEDALERAGIPFVTVAGRGFYQRPEVRDLLNILRAIADPGDDLALVGALRSPALAVSDEALYRLCRWRSQQAPADRLWSVLDVASESAGLNETDRKALCRARDILHTLHRRAGRTTVADVLKAFLDDTGYRAMLLCQGQARAVRNVSKLLSDARAGGMASVGEFLEYIGRLRDSGAREGEARAAGEGAVQIMSVHAAKGLEFPVLVIGDITYSPMAREGLILDPELGPLLPCKDRDTEQKALIYDLARTAERDREAAEEDRLLYVAATRAAEMLILSGCVHANQSGTLGNNQRGWLSRLAGEECLGLAEISTVVGDGRVCHILQVGTTPVACTLYGPEYRPPVAMTMQVDHSSEAPAFRPPVLLSTVTPPEAPQEDGPSEPPEKVTEDEGPMRRVWRVVPHGARPWAPRWVIGVLVHTALAEWRFPDESFDEWARTLAREQGLVDGAQIEHARREARKLLLRLRAHPLYREIDTAERRYHEVPYSLELDDGETENGVIDVLYRRDGRWTIVEFKTDRPRQGEKLTDLLHRKRYLKQMARYVDAVEALLGERPRLLLCMLDMDRRIHLVEDPILATNGCQDTALS